MSRVHSVAGREAAVALAKRGENVDHIFIGLSPGGVGQSLFTQHLHAMMGLCAQTAERLPGSRTFVCDFDVRDSALPAPSMASPFAFHAFGCLRCYSPGTVR